MSKSSSDGLLPIRSARSPRLDRQVTLVPDQSGGPTTISATGSPSHSSSYSNKSSAISSPSQTTNAAAAASAGPSRTPSERLKQKAARRTYIPERKKGVYSFPPIMVTLQTMGNPRDRLKNFREGLWVMLQVPESALVSAEWRMEAIGQMRAVINDTEIEIAELDRERVLETRRESALPQKVAPAGPLPVVPGRTITTGLPQVGFVGGHLWGQVNVPVSSGAGGSATLGTALSMGCSVSSSAGFAAIRSRTASEPKDAERVGVDQGLLAQSRGAGEQTGRSSGGRPRSTVTRKTTSRKSRKKKDDKSSGAKRKAVGPPGDGTDGRLQSGAAASAEGGRAAAGPSPRSSLSTQLTTPGGAAPSRGAGRGAAPPDTAQGQAEQELDWTEYLYYH